MMQVELLTELKKLPMAERLELAEAAIASIREELQQSRANARQEKRRKLAAAAQRLLDDYTHDKELTALSSLDGDPFL